ncbi:MAG: homoserine kinase [Gammaproteobacteria bacterium]|nr:homoserine kinase [Gammaproteobacteria bacterium]
MSVFTIVRRPELETFLRAYEVGELVDFEGIEAGIENTNYFVTTSAGRYVLTLFEATPRAELGYFLDLMAFLAEHGLPSAHPIADRDGAYLRTLNERPAALVVRLPGRSVARPNAAQCQAIGAALATMHRAVAEFPGYRANDRGPAWRRAVAARIAPRLAAGDRVLLEAALAADALERVPGLPGGVIHADLFHDNALFEGERLSGIIDFYYAHNGPFIYDLAVTVADWCFAAGELDARRAGALVAAYHAVRPLTAAEQASWAAAIRTAGLRFWISRLQDQIFPRDAALTFIKDPAPFRAVLQAGLENGAQLARIWPAP